jgi:hypothetical protein
MVNPLSGRDLQNGVTMAIGGMKCRSMLPVLAVRWDVMVIGPLMRFPGVTDRMRERERGARRATKHCRQGENKLQLSAKTHAGKANGNRRKQQKCEAPQVQDGLAATAWSAER